VKIESEASAIARRIQNYIVIENDHAADQFSRVKDEPGIFKNMLLIVIMGLAVVFTQITLFLVRTVKWLEN